MSLISIACCDTGNFFAISPTSRSCGHHSCTSADACTNQAESYFSRLRRCVDGQHHHISKQYLHQYANETAWREDHGRTPNGGLFTIALSSALHSPVRRQWKGYWQRRPA